ncbi:STAS/SEC14 domain-containing protein [Hymenobacter sp. ASUV-10]|uniref:STAS/SEC14 domain-containing protein n=1 Tax=Hymenobacter aranciens TaxID=3063996 RepID=A0ABT9BEW1_9BACT|nr:STAS/SEC14 domain-containing protein [Hymenobacter sp. ASUV-10]MDO7876188.1 STAS/SEC14 domain-containing protein [Hymenobacter sp. ASUV-10]
MQELKTSLGRTYLTVDTDETNRWIAVDWQGYLTAESIKEGAKAYTAALAASGFACVLNDTRSVRGPWDHTMDWVINEWAPNAAKAGLQYFALVSTPETLADGSAANFYAQLTAFHAEVFSTTEEAQQWLLACQQRG